MKNRFFKFFYKLHIYVGLFVALHLFVFITTGAILLFKDEIEGTVAQGKHVEAEVLPELNVHVQNILKRYPSDRPLAFNLEEDHPEIAQLRLGLNGSKLFRESRRIYFNIHTGEEVAAPKKPSSFMDFILRLHRELLLGSNGKIYVGLVGLLYAFVLISGFFIYGNFAKKTYFGEVRQGTPRTFSSDWHRLLGTSVFAWGLMIALTGLLLGVSSTLIKVFQYSELQKLTRQYPQAPAPPYASLDQVLAEAHKALPGASFDYLAFPDSQFSPPGHFLVLMHGSTAWTERLVELAVVDAVSGQLSEVRSLPWYLKAAMLSEPLHFGNYGGLILKIVWFLLSVISLFLPVTGLYIWLDRRRKRSEPDKGVRTISLRIWKGSNFQRRYLVPTVIAVFSVVAVVGSFLTEGYFNTLLVLLLVLPVYFVLRVFWQWLRKGSL
ncbi:MAG: membrane protein [Bdellovibrio sp. ArHS]|uniref:PepSY-associated TM helix domain-containing protein n=1 Tax=Bdellovibrio sp. ArHS TaxID=1569284 RepID=UPI000582C458|nr:PepSY-associated TM helix domain-containing protein [Bdellovibrio sp. ArHS]KHD89662.1 MAG: membrane protein [Bdellovibrio sp. ArHS]